MSTPMFDVHELVALEQDLGKVPGVAVKLVTAAALENGETLRGLWSAGIASTGGSHLPHLPAAVTVEPLLGIGSIGVQVGPETGKTQGALGLGDEFGSVNTPPHGHGMRSADTVAPLFGKAVEDAAGSALESLT